MSQSTVCGARERRSGLSEKAFDDGPILLTSGESIRTKLGRSEYNLS